MARDSAYDIVLNGTGLILVRAGELPEGARAWNVQVQGVYASKTDEGSSRYGSVSPQIESPVAWSDLTLGYGSWNDNAPRKYHWGYGVDCRFPGMVLPGPLLTIVSIGGTTVTADIEEHDGALWVMSGRYVKKINTVYLVEEGFDAGSGKTCTDLEEWNGTLYVARGFGAGDFIASHAAGSPHDAWTTDNDVLLGKIWPLWDRLYGSTALSKVASVATDPMTLADWGADYQIGDTTGDINSLAAIEETLYIGKDDGVYGLDSSGQAPMLAPELRPYRCAVNCTGMKVWHGTLIVPHLRGLLQYIPRGDGTHTIMSITPGHGAMEDNPIRGHVTALAGDDRYLYVALWTGQYDSFTVGTTYILAGEQDINTGVWAWHPLIKFPDNKRCDAMFLSGLWTNPHLWMGYGAEAAYIIIPRGASNPKMDANCTYALTGTLRYQRHDFNAPAATKVWKSCEIEADNLSLERYLTAYTRIDGGAWVSWGNAYFSPRSRILFGASGISGKSIELRIDWTLPESTNPIVLRSVVLRAAERPLAVETMTAQIELVKGVRLYNGGVNSNTGAEVWAKLKALVEGDDVVTLTDPLGIDRQVLVVPPLVQNEIRSEGDKEAEMVAVLQMVTWDATTIGNVHMFDLGYSGIGWYIPWSIPWLIGGVNCSISDSTIFSTNAENVRPIIVVTDHIDELVMTNEGTGQTLTLSTLVVDEDGNPVLTSGGEQMFTDVALDVPDGDAYTIDCTTKTVRNRAGALVVGITVDDFFVVPGENVITVTGKTIHPETEIKLLWV